MTDDFPRRRAVTRGFRLGAPRNFTVAPLGDRVFFLRSDGAVDPVNHLWQASWDTGGYVETRLVDVAALLGTEGEQLSAAERSRRERLRETSGGITGYTTDDDCRLLVFVLSGDVYSHDLAAGRTTRHSRDRSFTNPVVDPTGRRIAAAENGSLFLIPLDAQEEPALLRRASREDEAWGVADFIAAEELDRHRGLWWAPDGESLLLAHVDESDVATWYIGDPARPDVPPVAQRYPAAGTPNAVVDLSIVAVDSTADAAGVAVDWDTDAWEYLGRVHWTRHGPPVIALTDRTQTQVVTLAIDPRTGATTELARDTDDRWVDLVPGVPRMTERGLVTVSLDLACDTRRLTVAGAGLTTPPGLQVHAVVDADDLGVLFIGSKDDPAGCDAWRLAWDGTVARVSEPGGWSVATSAGGTAVISRADLTRPQSSAEVVAAAGRFTVVSHAETPGVSPHPEFLGTDGWSRIAVLFPSSPHRAGPLPIIMSPYGGPHAQRSIRAASAFTTEQWLADQGFCVVVADGPGSMGYPSNEFAIKDDLATGPLRGQIDALRAVAARYGEAVNTGRVGIRGWSFGGYLAALAVLERPDVFHVAVAGAPVTDWSLYDTAYTERYLGTPRDNSAAYTRSGLIERARLLRRPLLLVHGTSDDNVVFAHTLRLSSALLAAGRPHSVLPLSGVTHMTPQEVIAENLMRTELEFLGSHLRG